MSAFHNATNYDIFIKDDPDMFHENNELFNGNSNDITWFTLTNDLTNNVHDLDIDDMKFSPHPLSGQDDDDPLAMMDNPLQYHSQIIPELDIIHETCESSSLEDEADAETGGQLTETTVDDSTTTDHCQNEFVPRYKKPLTNYMGLRRLLPKQQASTSESCNSDSSIQSYSHGQGKRRGGWPKGRKRKPTDSSEAKPPRAPSTGYVLYLIEQRKKFINSDLPFPEVTKKIGNEWSRLSAAQKKHYLDKAELDKKRYRDELRQYRKSDVYQRKRLKFRPKGTEESDFDGNDEIEEDDPDDLYCRTCDQWFVNYHNKKEHLIGKLHLGKVNKWKQAARAGAPVSSVKTAYSRSAPSSSCSLDESSLDAADSSSNRRSSFSSQSDNPDNAVLNVGESILKTMKMFQEREDEVNYLRGRLNDERTLTKMLNKGLSDMKNERKMTGQEAASLKNEEKHMKKIMSNFMKIISKNGSSKFV